MTRVVKSFIVVVALVGALTLAILDRSYRREFIALATGAVCGFFGAEVPRETRNKGDDRDDGK